MEGGREGKRRGRFFRCVCSLYFVISSLRRKEVCSYYYKPGLYLSSYCTVHSSNIVGADDRGIASCSCLEKISVQSYRIRLRRCFKISVLIGTSLHTEFAIACGQKCMQRVCSKVGSFLLLASPRTRLVLPFCLFSCEQRACLLPTPRATRSCCYNSSRNIILKLNGDQFR